MCGRFGRFSRFERIAQLSAISIRNEAGEIQQSYNVAPGTLQPIILNTREGAVLRPLLWGLVPYWASNRLHDLGVIGIRRRRARARSMLGPRTQLPNRCSGNSSVSVAA